MFPDLPSLRNSVVPNHYLGMSWCSHLSFAYDLMGELKPRVFVELGSHAGESYFAFCQSVQENGLSNTRCVAVDTWQGDPQAGWYDEDVFTKVERANRTYGAFSQLMRCRFDDAVSAFADGSIDLLHIDGLHEYEAVRHDFENWLPKMSPRGIILFHDTYVFREGFGVSKLWPELKQHYPTFEFQHGYGLGVLKVNAAEKLESAFLTSLFESTPTQAEAIRNYYLRCHERIQQLKAAPQNTSQTPARNSSVEILGRVENYEFAQSINERVNESIYRRPLPIQLDIVLQTHSQSNSQNLTRYCDAPKAEVMRRSVISLVRSMNACGPHVKARLVVLDDHSSPESITELHKILSKLECPYILQPLESRGIMNSILACYEWGLKHSRGELVYFAQDDYLYEPSAIHEMIDSYFRFKFMVGGQEVGIHPFNDPFRYYAPGNVENTRIVQGSKRHWRLNFFTPSTFMVHQAVIEKNWDLFHAMGRSEVGPRMEDDTINRIWRERGVMLFTPIPSLALHLQAKTEMDPYMDWKALWESAAAL